MYVRNLTVSLLLWLALAVPANSDESLAVVLETTKGSITLELEPAKAPVTVANFLRYVDSGFYDGTLFHRAIPGFMAQAGGFGAGLAYRQPAYPSVRNESVNGLKNVRGSLSMARRSDPDSASSQFFINVVHNPSLDGSTRAPGYTVFGRVVDGMEVVDRIVRMETTTAGGMRDVPVEEVVIVSARRAVSSETQALSDPEGFVEGVHYTVLDNPVATRDGSKIEVVQAFSYGCPHCYAFESMSGSWRSQVPGDVEFRRLPAVWSQPMQAFARAYFAGESLGVDEEVHLALYKALLVDQQDLRDERSLATWYLLQGIDLASFYDAYNSEATLARVAEAAELTAAYGLSYVPQIIVDGRYVVDAARAGGREEMLAVTEHLIALERARREGETLASR